MFRMKYLPHKMDIKSPNVMCTFLDFSDISSVEIYSVAYLLQKIANVKAEVVRNDV